MPELKPGEKYLSINILNSLNVVAFKNKDKKEDDKQPHYKGNGIAVWVRTKKAAPNPPVEEVI